MELPFGLNPHETDPGAWGASLLYNAELLLACLDISQAKSVAEVGAFAGDLTRLLLLWAEPHGARVIAIDPAPHELLEQLARQREDLELVRETSLQALEHIAIPDVLIIDGDHNYYTVTEELRRAAAARDGLPPLLLVHDVCWPHARRDDYFDPEQIPAEHRQPVVQGGTLYPGHEGIWPGALPFRWAAAREGGARNGVLTAVEDFVAERPELVLAVVPTFFGLGVVWHQDMPYAAELAAMLKPWDRNPLIARLERNRVLHLSSAHFQSSLFKQAQDRLHEAEKLLQKMLDSRAFWAAEMYLRLRQRGKPQFSRKEVRELLNRPQPIKDPNLGG